MPNNEVTSGIVDLLSTILEGLEHIRNRLREGHLADTMYLFEDITRAFYSINNSLEPIISELPENQLLSLTDQLINIMEDMTTAYKQDDIEKSKADMQFLLLPGFKKWKIELERCLNIYNAS
ncbi:MAG: hypothetical protein ABFC94_10440 [Syntrophomonas sp.]